jgi:ATP-dependent DNA ligase
MVQVVVESGGEGVVLRKPKSLYDKGRSPYLLKIKVERRERREARGRGGGEEGRREDREREVMLLFEGFARR